MDSPALILEGSDALVSSVPVHQVLESGQIRRLGEWIHAERRLELLTAGFPLLPAGHHAVEGDLPWIFWDMCPSGFLGKRFARLERGLSLNAEPRTWGRDEALRALTEAGDDLPGSLIIGERSLARWQEARAREASWELEADRFHRGEIDAAPGLARSAGGSVVVGRRPWDPPEEIDAWLTAESSYGGSSSLGGERPKLATRTATGGSLLKFSPPVAPPETPEWAARRAHFEATGLMFPATTPQGQRWADLLRVEAHCAQTLRAFGVAAVDAAAAYSLSGRVVLEIARYDRTPDWGRRGASTLYWYSRERLEDVNVPAPHVVARLVSDGHLDASAAAIVERVHAFSDAIGNTDAHLGNYGLVFDDQGKASLAPFYDILPMALAPAHDELPDARLLPRVGQPADPTVASWVDELVRRVSADGEISSPFRELWYRHLGR